MRTHALNQHKVLQPVVRLVVVDMVNKATLRDRAMFPLPDPSVLEHPLAARERQPDVPRHGDRAVTAACPL